MPKIVILYRNKKFLSDLWSTLFLQLNIKLLYFTTYRFQSDDASKRTNQTLKIALRFFILPIDSRNWFSLVDALSRKFNNFFISTNRLFNKICYDFTSFINLNLMQNDVSKNFNAIIQRTQVKNNIAHE